MNRSGRPNGSGRPGGAGRRGGGILASVAVAVLAAVTLIATGTPSGASAPGGEAPRPAASHPASAPAPAFAPGADRGSGAGAGVEADVAYHGHVSLWGGRVGVWLTTENHGPAPVSGVTVRLRFSVPLDPGATLPPGCLRTGPATVQCGTGTMRAAGSGVRVALDVAVVGEPAEVGVDIDTAWSGGTYDRNPANNTHRVLAPATGDPYSF
ncbi:hypothetical protein [Streptomyces xanthochromogenes]|uniref:hypothetical protein n=1 Tax=Streptomyces xanthochromogenes TaxID=67384 RepID=UPI001E5BF787|nr:hypothetical protein [Streptomyces xanthochromogenes]